MTKWVERVQDLEIYQQAFSQAMEVFNLTKSFPREEAYSMSDQIRRSSRSVAANIFEAWGKRQYKASFINCLVDAQAEALETQNWLAFALSCGYLETAASHHLVARYDKLVFSIGSMVLHAEKWTKQ